jgi:hypothetical protein
MGTEAISVDLVRNESKIYVSPSIYGKYRKAKLLDSMVKENERFLTKIKVELKEFMGDHGILVDARGVPLVTWQTQQKPRHQNFDFDSFIRDYPDLFDKYSYKYPTNQSRVFRLK